MEDHRLTWGRLVGGAILAWALTLGVPAWLIAVPKFDAQTRRSIEGEVVDVQTPQVGKRRVLDFGLRAQPVRFRVQAEVFSDALAAQIPSGFQPGATIKVQVPDSQLRKPFSPAPLRVPTVSVDAIAIAEREVLTLEASRAWHDGNRRIAYYLFAMFLGTALYLSHGVWSRLRSKGQQAT